MSPNDWLERLHAVECPAFDARRRAREAVSGAPQDAIVYARGRGDFVWSADGVRYLDYVAGFGALALGHCPPRLSGVLATQAERLVLALGDVFGSTEKIQLMEALAALHPVSGARVMLGTSGADAVTAALKTAVLSTGRPGVIAFEGAYHGLSHGPLAACGLHASFREPFDGQLGKHVQFAPYPDSEAALDGSLSAVRSLLRGETPSAATPSGATPFGATPFGATLSGAMPSSATRPPVGAVLVEPVLGRGGCVVPPRGFLRELRGLCDEAGVLLIADEIWTGIGRCGSWLASVADGAVPDLVCVGKALGGGLPISACIGTPAVMEAWGRHGGSVLHTATHFGAPLSCAVARAVIGALREEGWVDRSGDAGEALIQTLTNAIAASPARGHVAEVRGRGLMVGVALRGGSAQALRVVRSLLRRHVIALTGGVGGDVVTFTPALNVDRSTFKQVAEALVAALEEKACP